MSEGRDVHTEHCCIKHGCKYGEPDECTVCNGTRTQSYPCEYCRDDKCIDYEQEYHEERKARYAAQSELVVSKARIEELEQKLRTTSLEALAISDTNNEIQARLSEAVKVLEMVMKDCEESGMMGLEYTVLDEKTDAVVRGFLSRMDAKE